MDVRHESKQDLTKSLRDLYWRAGKAEKGRILDTFCGATGYHRKYAMTVLRWGTAKRGLGPEDQDTRAATPFTRACAAEPR